MENITSSIITPVVESLMVPLKKHLGFWLSYPKYVKNMEAKMKQLEDTAKEVERKRDMARVNTEVVPEHVEPWLKDVESMKLDEKSIPTGAIGCFNVSKRYKAGKRSFEILKEIEDLKARVSEIEFTKEKIPLAMVPSTSKQPSTSTHNSFASRDMMFNDALNALRSNDETQKMIALCGTGGVGKTTMMEQLKKAVEDSKTFDWIVKVVVGENNDAIALQRAIADSIRVDLTEADKGARAERLHKTFEGMSQQGQKQILVIMDDIWKVVDLNDVGLTNPLPKGFKMLFTSRDTSVCYHMGVKNDSIFNVGVLNFEEANSLFFGIVGPFILDPDDLEYQKIGGDIVKCCGGLPIALKTIAINLRGRIKDAWNEVFSNLKHNDLEDLNNIVHTVFEISYNNLPKEDDKAIFLLSGIFPDDFNIPIEDLMRYGWGLKLFTNVHTLAEARRRTNICVHNLMGANLLTESETMGCVKMHDLIRAFVLSNFAKVKQASIVNRDDVSRKLLTKDGKECYERILLKCTGMSNLPGDFKFPSLSMLMLMDGSELRKLPDEIMEKLEVVSYENMHIPTLLVMFEHSTKLRTLCLRSCSFINDDISLLGGLCNLEILSFADCEIRKLPTTIGNLKRLKLLDLTGCVDLRIDNGVFNNLDSLEELYIRAYEGSPIRLKKANLDELEILSDGLFALELEFVEYEVKPKNMSFKNLERFRISIGCQLTKLYSDEEFTFRNTFEFVGDYNELLECQISNLFEKTEILSLEVNGMLDLDDHSFSNLKVLNVHNCEDLTSLFTVDVASGLKKLERLTISKCHAMRTLVAENSRVGVIRFHKLTFMSLTDLPEMVRFWDNVIEFPGMVELKLDGLPYFTSIYPHSHHTSELHSLLNKKVVIPQLEILDISRMENLKHIWACETVDKSNVSMLRNITVEECDNLMNLFPSNPLSLLNYLEEIVVEKCGSIEVLFNMEFESVCETMECSKLRSIRVAYLGMLKELWRITGVDKCDIHIKCFNKVESIEIQYCSIFRDIFTPVTTNFDLGALTDYATYNIGAKMNDECIPNGDISETDQCTNPNATYPSYLLHKSRHLQTLYLNNDERVEEVVFEMDSHQPLLGLPYLEFLNLIELKEMSHVWKCNWNKFLILQPLLSPFQNLTNITVRNCHKIKYLFSPLMAQYLSNLRIVHIWWCDGIEQVISNRDDENTPASSNKAYTLFPNLDILYLQYLECLKSIDDESQSGDEVIGACWSLCQYPTMLMKMTEVFESEIRSTDNNVDEGSARSVAGTTLTTPTLKPSPTVVVAPQLSNLKHVNIYNCDLLSHVFTFSTLESLNQLKSLTVGACKAMQVIVKKENSGTSTKDHVVVVFPHLECLRLKDLPNLKGFSLGMNDFRFPLLDDVTIIDCPQMMVFTSGKSEARRLKYISTRLGKHNGTINDYHQTTFLTSSSSHPLLWSFHNLIEINTDNKEDLYFIDHFGKTIIPSNALPQLEKLEKIQLRRCGGVEEVFEVASSEDNESQIVVKISIPNLKQVDLEILNELKYLWKSNQWMVLEFPNLTTISISECNSLEHVFTCSMVGSLVQLQDLKISWCRNIEVIVKKEEKEEQEEEECVVKGNEIMLPRLKSLKLEYLPSLKGFCLGNEDFLCPSLDTLQINSCPAVTVFTKGHVSTPELEVIDTDFGMHHVKPYLNSFIKVKQEEGYKF